MKKGLISILDKYDEESPYDILIVDEDKVQEAYDLIKEYGDSREDLAKRGKPWEYSGIFDSLTQHGVDFQRVDKHSRYKL